MTDFDIDDVVFILLDNVFSKIRRLHNEDPDLRIFQIVHRFRRAVTMVIGRTARGTSSHYNRARANYLSLPPLVWVSWDAGRGKKADDNVAILQRELKAAASG